MSVSPEKLHDSYVEDLANMFEKQGYKMITEGGIPKYRGKEWGEPDMFVLKEEGGLLVLDKIVEVTLSDLKEGEAPNTLLSKCRKIKEYYNPPEIIVFEPTAYTSNYYSASLGRFSHYDEYNTYLHEKWKKEGLNVTFWNEWDLEKQRSTSNSQRGNAP